MHDDLIRQAHRLARLDPQKPKQANLRRAISAAYYALFHFLADQYSRQLIGTGHARLAFRQVLARGMEHGEMNDACKSFSGGTLKQKVAKGLPLNYQIAREVQQIAQTFVEMQQKRHLADYDLSETFLRPAVISDISQVERSINSYQKLSDAIQKRFFLGCLASWKRLSNRS